MNTLKVYKIEGDLPRDGIVFQTREDAEAFLKLGIMGVRQTYIEGEFGQELVPLTDLSIQETDIP